jgi:hypothetical protein
MAVMPARRFECRGSTGLVATQGPGLDVRDIRIAVSRRGSDRAACADARIDRLSGCLCDTGIPAGSAPSSATPLSGATVFMAQMSGQSSFPIAWEWDGPFYFPGKIGLAAAVTTLM